MPPSFSVIGCGRVGSTLARHLTAAGFRPRHFISRHRASAEAAAACCGAGVAVETFEALTPAPEILWITTPDDCIEEVAQGLARAGAVGSGTAVLHCSGLLSSEVLEAVRQAGAAAGSLHPLQSVPVRCMASNPFQGVPMAVEGDPAAVARAREAAAALGGAAMEVATAGKALYHAAAVTASNYLVTLMAAALRLLEGAGIPAAAGWPLLEPLVQGTLGNIRSVGAEAALTGPVARGDVATLRAHQAAIRRGAPDLAAFYNRLGAATVALAARRGAVSEELRECFAAPEAPASDPLE